MTVAKPSFSPAVVKKINKLMPMTISGMIIGTHTSVWIACANR